MSDEFDHTNEKISMNISHVSAATKWTDDNEMKLPSVLPSVTDEHTGEQDEVIDMQDYEDSECVDKSFISTRSRLDSIDKHDPDDENTKDEESLNTASLGDHAQAIKSFFFSSLEEAAVRLGGHVTSSWQDWRIDVFKRFEGVAQGNIDVFYVSPAGKTFRSRLEAILGRGVTQNVSMLRSMTRDQLHELSSETREKLLISQLLQTNSTQGTCTEVHLIGGEISLTFSNAREEFPSSPSVLPSYVIPCFTVGNTTVLNWGKIVPDANFHTATQIYPLGFKCIRQEHDVLYDRVIDCLCEIDGITEDDVLYPLFRITVNWVSDTNLPCIRVYEAKSPQLAWQAVRLETLGVDHAIPVSPTEDDGMMSEEAWTDAEAEMDEEEIKLREEIRVMRRDFYRALRNEQSLHLQGAFKPRVVIENADGFVDEILIRMIEGMPSAEKCELYRFVNTRVRDGCRKHMMQCLSRADTLVKHLDKIKKKYAVKEVIPKSKPKESKDKERELLAESKKRERMELIEKNKRLKAESKESRAIKLNMMAVQKQKMKDVEKAVRSIRDTLMKDIKRRRTEAKLRIEGIAEIEDSRSQVAGKATKKKAAERIEPESSLRGPRPPSQHTPLPFAGDCFGELLELWGFLVTFSDPLSIRVVPSIERLQECFRYIDPLTHKLATKAMAYSHAFDSVVSRYTEADVFENVYLEMRQARALTDKLGVALCRPLMPEFYRLVGMEPDQQGEGNKFMLNALTWMEITRVVLLGAASKETGIPDIDIMAATKGRGYTFVPDASDRRVMRLCRKRLASNYKYREENQDAICGFVSGFCVRVPYAYSDSDCSDFTWKELIDYLKTTPDSCGWKIHAIVSLAILACCGLNAIDKDRVKTTFKSALSPAVFHATDASATKQIVLPEMEGLREKYDLPEDRATAFQAEMKVISINDIRLRINGGEGPMSFAPPLYNVDEAKHIASQIESHIETEVGLPGDEYEELGEEKETLPKKKSVVDDITDSLKVLWTSKEVTPEEEIAMVEKLSLASQRCFIVVRDVMNHPQSSPFIYPVDVTQTPGYYRRVKNPVSLSDIRRHLIRGGYEGSFTISKFYLDVNLVLENAFTFNSEISPIGQSAIKMTFIFERLFLETVLSWDNPLAHNECCSYCRSDDIASAAHIAICDRCESTYHLTCLEVSENNNFDKRQEWYCPGCIEQFGVASTHHYRTAIVSHPATKIEGEVVGIDQENLSLRFTILFKDSSREVWTAEKLKAHRIIRPQESTAEDQARAPPPPITSTSVTAAANTDVVIDPCTNFPSGYTEEDIDLVSGLCRGYQSWGTMLLLLPPHIDDKHSAAAEACQTKNTQFLRYQRVLELLGPLGSPDSMSSRDWLHVLLALARKNLSASNSLLAPAIASLDVDSGFVPIDATTTALSDIPIRPKVQIGDELRFTSEARLVPSAESASASAVVDDESEDAAQDGAGDDSTASETASEVDLKGEADDTASEDLFSDDDLFSEPPAGIESDKGDNTQEQTVVTAEGSGGIGEEEQPVADEGEETEDEDLFESDFDPSNPNKHAPVEDTVSWEAKRLCRVRGREDALLTKQVVAELIGTVDLTDDAAALAFAAAAAAEGGDIRDASSEATMFQTAVKACVPRATDIADLDEWQRAWAGKMDAIMSRPDTPPLCQFCGFSEAQLLSSFVYGQTHQEWLQSEQKSKLEQIDPETSCLWLPASSGDADVEQQECAKIGSKPLKQGSLIVHECCAELMATSRRTVRRKANSKDEDAMNDLMNGLRKGKRNPIGMDIEGNVYWIFPGSHALYICSPDTASTYGFSQDTAVLQELYANNKIAEDGGSDAMELAIRAELKNRGNYDEFPTRWSVYSSTTELASVIAWLHPTGCERILRKLLEILFPEAVAHLYAKQLENEVAMEIVKSQLEGEASHSVPPFPDLETPTKEVDISQSTDAVVVAVKVAHQEGDDMSTGDEMEVVKGNAHDSASDDDDDDEEEEVELWVRPKRTVGEIPVEETQNPPRFRVDNNVLVLCDRGEIVREAKIYEIRKLAGTYFYNVKFVGNPRPDTLNNWRPEAVLHKKTDSTMLIQQEVYFKYVKANCIQAPPIIQTLHALRYTRLSDRAGAGLGRCRGNITYSDVSTTLGMMKSALLTLEAALPCGCVDENDDKWGGKFSEPWRNAVVLASSASAIMECQLCLEYAIKSSWIKPVGSKILSSLPSRAYSAKYATYSLAAMRLFTLDQSIRYEKIILPNGERPANYKSNRGRKSKAQIEAAAKQQSA